MNSIFYVIFELNSEPMQGSNCAAHLHGRIG